MCGDIHPNIFFAVFEIPDFDAERLMTPGDIAQYICDRNDVYE